MKLCEFRKKARLSQQEVANLIKVDVSTVSKYETKHILPSLPVMVRIRKMTRGEVDMEDFTNDLSKTPNQPQQEPLLC